MHWVDAALPPLAHPRAAPRRYQSGSTPHLRATSAHIPGPSPQSVAAWQHSRPPPAGSRILRTALSPLRIPIPYLHEKQIYLALLPLEIGVQKLSAGLFQMTLGRAFSQTAQAQMLGLVLTQPTRKSLAPDHALKICFSKNSTRGTRYPKRSG